MDLVEAINEISVLEIEIGVGWYIFRLIKTPVTIRYI